MALYGFGDSYVVGHGFPDCPHGDPDNPSQFAWVKLLADRMGVPGYNYGMPGIGNGRIAGRVLGMRDKFTRDDVVVISWTFPDRYDIYCEDLVIEKTFQVKPQHYSNTIRPGCTQWVSQEVHDTYYGEIHNHETSLFHTLTYIMAIELSLRGRTKQVIHTTHGIEDAEYKQKEYEKCNVIIEPMHPWFNLPIWSEQHVPGYDDKLPDGHPGHKFHLNFANLLYQVVTRVKR